MYVCNNHHYDIKNILNFCVKKSHFHILAVVGIKGHRVWQPAGLMVKLIELRRQTDGDHSPHSCVNDCHLQDQQLSALH